MMMSNFCEASVDAHNVLDGPRAPQRNTAALPVVPALGSGSPPPAKKKNKKAAGFRHDPYAPLPQGESAMPTPTRSEDSRTPSTSGDAIARYADTPLREGKRWAHDPYPELTAGLNKVTVARAYSRGVVVPRKGLEAQSAAHFASALDFGDANATGDVPLAGAPKPFAKSAAATDAIKAEAADKAPKKDKAQVYHHLADPSTATVKDLRQNCSLYVKGLRARAANAGALREIQDILPAEFPCALIGIKKEPRHFIAFFRVSDMDTFRAAASAFVDAAAFPGGVIVERFVVNKADKDRRPQRAAAAALQSA